MGQFKLASPNSGREWVQPGVVPNMAVEHRTRRVLAGVVLQAKSNSSATQRMTDEQAMPCEPRWNQQQPLLFTCPRANHPRWETRRQRLPGTGGRVRRTGRNRHTVRRPVARRRRTRWRLLTRGTDHLSDWSTGQCGRCYWSARRHGCGGGHGCANGQRSGDGQGRGDGHGRGDRGADWHRCCHGSNDPRSLDRGSAARRRRGSATASQCCGAGRVLNAVDPARD
jgi:hypothetical protein